MPRKFIIVITCLALLGLSLSPASPLALPSIPNANAATRTISLVGVQPGWNASQPSGPNPTITVTQGDTITFNLSSGDFAHNFFIDLAGNGMPNCPPNVGCTAKFGPTTTATVTIPVDFPPGTYKYVCSLHVFSMKGNFIVQPIPDFSLSSNPSSLTINEGSTDTSTISIGTNDNASGNVTLTASVSPSGPTVGINPTIVRLSSKIRSANATLTVFIPGGTAPAHYTVSITGDNGTASHSATVEVSVPSPDFVLSLSSSSGFLLPGSSTNFTLTLTSIGGLSGTINLSDHVSSSGVNATLSPSSLTVSPGAPAISMLHLATSSSTPAGVYNITITGSSTVGQHSTTVTLIVVNPPRDGMSFSLIGLVVIVTVGVSLVAGLTTYLYRRPKPIRETPGQ